ncbi:MAG: glycerol-3-phosphate 1-O-acyltransferase PlsB [Gammaproteobacteria bacterium]|nr:glycerol-3-phosphate 1-O-acyltransferase PlsB [Gammaproteobacteria bacterium]MDH3768230.1 glycerol-3-phosphate 1-O-acyltransferase PlsB [Gammaproteobacteria bacterium]
MRSESIYSDWLGLGPPLRWLGRKLLFLWVRTKILPADVAEKYLPAEVPVLYVLANDALSSRLVVEEACIRHELPRLSEPPTGSGDEYRSVVFLRRLRGWLRRRGEPVQSPRLVRMIDAVHANPAMDMNVVPVSVFWGRSPDKERAPLKLLFSETWAPAGRIRKMLIVLVHGRQTLVQFSEPVSLRKFVDEAHADGLNDERMLRKLSRVLRVHMRRLRVATIGPDLSHRRTLRGQILRSPSVREAIDRHATRQGISPEAAAHKAGNFVDEIAADYSHAFIRFMERLLSWLWNRVYDGIEINHVDAVRTIAEECEIVYVPCHRSHFDYLLLSYVLYHAGLVPPHVATGINLNIPIVGPLLRRGGAFFLRRSFGGNKLYTAVFQKYLALNLARGVPIEYFIEGTRSRTGRLLSPKSGMLAMTIRGHVRQPSRPVAFVPVYFGYEKLLEGRSYIGELSGDPKKKESFFGFLRSLGAIRRKLGKVYVNFGLPIPLDELLDQHNDAWRGELQTTEKPAWLTAAVDDAANRIMRHINMAAAVPPVSLLALPLLSAPRQAMLEDVLRVQLDLLLSILRDAPYADRVTFPEMTGRSIIDYGLEMNLIKRRPHPLGDVLSAQGNDAIMLTYNRNNIMHLFSLPSMIACCFLNNRRMRVGKIVELGKMVYPYVQAELFLHWEQEDLETVLRQILSALVDHGLLEWESDGEVCKRPAVDTPGALQLSLLAHGALQRLERYYMTIALLLKHGPGHVNQSNLENLCQLMAQRMSMLYQFDAPESFAKPLFRDFIDSLRNAGVVWVDDSGLLDFDDRIRAVEDDANLVLGEQIRHSILQVIHV